VDLEVFDLRCGRPLMMLGIDEVTSGDATAAFSEYDSDRNREFREAFYEHWDIEYDPAWMQQLLEEVESFPYVKTRRAGTRRQAPR